MIQMKEKRKFNYVMLALLVVVIVSLLLVYFEVL